MFLEMLCFTIYISAGRMLFTGEKDMRNKRLYELCILAVLFVFIAVLPLFIFTGCPEVFPTEPTVADTCEIAYITLEPSSATAAVGDPRVVFTASAYDHDDVLIDPSPTFRFTCESREVQITPSGNRVYANPWTPTSAPAQIKVTARDCDGREYTAISTFTVTSSMIWLLARINPQRALSLELIRSY